MNKIKILLVSTLFFVGLLGPQLALPAPSAYAVVEEGGGGGTAPVSAEERLCAGSGGSYVNGKCATPGSTQTVEGIIATIVKTLLFIVGAIAVIMLIIGGLKYVISAGDQSAVTSAKNTILYAVVGIIIAFSAYAIVNFIIDRFPGATPPATSTTAPAPTISAPPPR